MQSLVYFANFFDAFESATNRLMLDAFLPRQQMRVLLHVLITDMCIIELFFFDLSNRGVGRFLSRLNLKSRYACSEGGGKKGVGVVA